jgi:hypothetical protein
MANPSFKLTVDIKELHKLVEELPDQLEEFLDMQAEDIVNGIVLSFGTSPSAPGDPPGVDTGALRASMRWENTGTLTRRIMDGVLYGVYQELGTETIAPRPFVGPAFERKRGNIGAQAKAFRLAQP